MQEHQPPTTNEWGRISRSFKNVKGGDISIRHAAEAVRLVELSAEDRLVLDIACGQGAWALQAAAELKTKHEGGGFKVLATDFAPAMVQACGREAALQDLSDVVECKQLDAENLEGIEDSSVDAIGCVFGAMFFPDAVRAFKEMHRVLRPGGRAAIVVWKKVATVSLFERLAEELAPTVKSSVPAMAYRFADPDVLRRHLEEAGFAAISIDTHETDWAGFKADDETISFLLDMPPLRQCYLPDRKDLAEQVLRRILEEEGTEFRQPIWENKSLIAVVRK